MIKTPESELETYVQYLCVEMRYKNLPHGYDSWGPKIYNYVGQTYWFHEDQPVDSHYFQMVVNEQDEPITKLCRKS